MLPYLIVILLCCPMVHAATSSIYQSREADGTIIYSDKPIDKSTQIVILPAENVIDTESSRPPVTKEKSVTEVKEVIPKTQPQTYAIFEMTTPSNQETFQNQPMIKVAITIDPPLKQNDKIQIYLDDKPWGSPRDTTVFEFSRPDRGTHTIYAELFNSEGVSLKKTKPYTIYVHQAHLGTPP